MPHHAIAICLPSRNEADSIGNVTTQVDRGLNAAFGSANCVLVNVDSSSDNTKQVFLSTTTNCAKISLPNDAAGKGGKILAFLQWCEEHNIEFAATIDTDITTIESDWAPKLISPLVEDKADFVSPLYERSRFEGNTTNHFVMPLVYSWFGKLVRQPIGGEFAFNKATYEYYLKQSVYPETELYGADNFLTMHALGAGTLRTTEVALGKKLHKPSFPKIVPMFQQVFVSTMLILKQYKSGQQSHATQFVSTSGSLGIADGGSFTHKAQLDNIRVEMLKEITDRITTYQNLVGLENTEQIIKHMGRITVHLWASIISKITKQVIADTTDEHTVRELSLTTTPLYLLRTITYMLESEHETPAIVESKLLEQANLIRRELLS